jgi:hypothetical protein
MIRERNKEVEKHQAESLRQREMLFAFARLHFSRPTKARWSNCILFIFVLGCATTYFENVFAMFKDAMRASQKKLCCQLELEALGTLGNRTLWWVRIFFRAQLAEAGK